VSRNGIRLTVLQGPLSTTTLKVATCERLAMLRSHGLGIVWRPAITRVWRKTVGATVPRFEQPDTYTMRRLMPAAWTYRLKNAVMGGTLTQALKLMHDAVVAQRKTMATEAKGVAVTLSPRSLYQRTAQRFLGQAKIFPKSDIGTFSETRSLEQGSACSHQASGSGIVAPAVASRYAAATRTRPVAWRDCT